MSPAADTGVELADPGPVARVLVMGLLPHLDRPFDYAVPASMDEARPGCRVKVTFAGKERDGFVLERAEHTESGRALAPLRRLVSDESVLTPAVLACCRDVAVRYAGTVSDLVRLAVPPRHARAERTIAPTEPAAAEPSPGRTEPTGPAGPEPSPGLLAHYAGGAAFAARLAAPPRPGDVVPRAALALRLAEAWPEVLADLVSQVTEGGVLVLVPDRTDLDQLAGALRERGLADAVELTGQEGPEARYKRFLTVLRGHSRLCIGNRSAAFAPVADLRLIVCVDPGDDLWEEPRSPYPHIRQVAAVRSAIEGAALAYVAHARDTWTQHMIATGWLADLVPLPAPLAESGPRVYAMDRYLRDREGAAGHTRLPSEALRLVRDGLARGPVLVQVPRSGYVPALACTFCGTRAACPTCHAVLAMTGRDRHLSCSVCGRRAEDYECPDCGRHEVRAAVRGSVRTAEELRRALPDVPFVVSGGHDGAEASVGPEPAVVVATPGAEPAAEGRYAAGLLMDGESMLGRAVYDADVEALRRWANASALVRPFGDAGQVLLVAEATLPAVQALVRQDTAEYARRVLQDRAALRLPPVAKMVELRGDDVAVQGVLDAFERAGSSDDTSVFGPIPVEDEKAARPQVRAVVRLDPTQLPAQLSALRGQVAGHTAAKRPGTLRLRVDPSEVF